MRQVVAGFQKSAIGVCRRAEKKWKKIQKEFLSAGRGAQKKGDPRLAAWIASRSFAIRRGQATRE
jgi:hypothetical protein